MLLTVIGKTHRHPVCDGLSLLVQARGVGLACGVGVDVAGVGVGVAGTGVGVAVVGVGVGVVGVGVEVGVGVATGVGSAVVLEADDSVLSHGFGTSFPTAFETVGLLNDG